MDNHQRSLTKIEVLLDKINLLHTSLQAAEQPDKYDLQLMRKYAQQMVEELEGLDESNGTASKTIDSPAPSSAPLFDFGSPEDPAQVEEDIVDEDNEQQSEPETEVPSFSFVDDAPADNEPEDEPTSVFATSPLIEDTTDDEEDEPVTLNQDTSDEASLNDIFKGEQKDLADHLKDKPIQSLKQEIDLNQKFWFIQELFEGDGSRFNQLLGELDQLHHFTEAERKIESFVGQYDWQEKEKAAAKFMQLVQRRYV